MIIKPECKRLLLILVLVSAFYLCILWYVLSFRTTGHCTQPEIEQKLLSRLFPALWWSNKEASQATPSTPEDVDPVYEANTVTQSQHVYADSGTAKVLLVMVISAPGNKAKRDVIRKTWKNSYVEPGKQFDVRFVIGTFQLAKAMLKSLITENDQHRDLLLLSDHLDSYRNLTRKVLHMFMWVDTHTNQSHILKTDDDSFPKLDAMESELKARVSNSSLYWGYITTKSTPSTKGKFAETKWTLCNKYIPYALGGGYIISRDLIHRVLVNADGLILYNNEDVSIGAWISPFQVERKHDDRFSSLRKGFERSQCNNYILIHHQNISDIETSDRSMKFNGALCYQ